MITKQDRLYAIKRKKLRNVFGWPYKGVNDLSKNHSLNCGCAMCRAKTFFRRYENKQERLKSKQDIQNQSWMD